MQEIELKYRLSPSDYTTLLNFLENPQKEMTLLNIYLDTACETLRTLGLSIRQRIEKTQNNLHYKLSSKSSLKRHKSLFICDEHEISLSREEFSSAIDNKTDILKKLGHTHVHINKPLSPIYFCTTDRKDYTFNQIPLTLDQTYYPDGFTDHELECEFSDFTRSRLIINNLFSTLSITSESQPHTKRSRAMLHKTSSPVLPVIKEFLNE